MLLNSDSKTSFRLPWNQIEYYSLQNENKLRCFKAKYIIAFFIVCYHLAFIGFVLYTGIEGVKLTNHYKGYQIAILSHNTTTLIDISDLSGHVYSTTEYYSVMIFIMVGICMASSLPYLVKMIKKASYEDQYCSFILLCICNIGLIFIYFIIFVSMMLIYENLDSSVKQVWDSIDSKFMELFRNITCAFWVLIGEVILYAIVMCYSKLN